MPYRFLLCTNFLSSWSLGTGNHSFSCCCEFVIVMVRCLPKWMLAGLCFLVIKLISLIVLYPITSYYCCENYHWYYNIVEIFRWKDLLAIRFMIFVTRQVRSLSLWLSIRDSTVFASLTSLPIMKQLTLIYMLAILHTTIHMQKMVNHSSIFSVLLVLFFQALWIMNLDSLALCINAEHFNPLLEQISKLEEALYNIQFEQHWLEAQTERQAIGISWNSEFLWIEWFDACIIFFLIHSLWTSEITFSFKLLDAKNPWLQTN